MRYLVDGSVRRSAGGRIVLGGSPLRLFRFTVAGGRLVDRILTGEAVSLTPAETRVADRLVAAGALHPQVESTDAGATLVTMVIPVRDRVEGLDNLLASVAAMPESDRPVTVIVVDDGSVDAVAVEEVVRSRGATLVRRAVPGGPAAARNAGLAAVRTSLVAFVDSDTVVEPGWLTSSVGHFDDERVGLVALRVRASSAVGVLAGFEAARSPLDLGSEPGRVAPRTRIAYVPAAALLGRVDAVQGLGGFVEDLVVGEDVDLVWRAVADGWRVRYEPAAVVIHEVRPTFRAWLRQRVDYGTSAALLDERHPRAVAPVSMSAWTLVSWLLAAAGHPLIGVAVAGGSAAALPRRLPSMPAGDAFMLAIRGHLGAGRLLARSVLRVWWPIAVLLALISRRGRKVFAACLVADAVQAVIDVRPTGAAMAATAGLGIADDLAYGTGVWVGCWRRRSLRAVLPSFTSSTSGADVKQNENVF